MKWTSFWPYTLIVLNCGGLDCPKPNENSRNPDSRHRGREVSVYGGGGVLGVTEGKGIEPFLFIHEAFIWLLIHLISMSFPQGNHRGKAPWVQSHSDYCRSDPEGFRDLRHNQRGASLKACLGWQACFYLSPGEAPEWGAPHPLPRWAILTPGFLLPGVSRYTLYVHNCPSPPQQISLLRGQRRCC